MMLVEYKHENHNDCYFIQGKKVANIESVIIDGVEYEVSREQKRVYYGEDEVGGPYPATSYHFFVELYMFGTHFPVDMNKICSRGVQVYAMDYTLEEEMK